jgi:hypothetical protein
MLDATQGPMGYDAAGNRYEASFGQAQLYENGNFYAGKAIYRTTPTGVSEPIVLLRSDTSAGLLGGMFATSLTVDTTNGRIFVPLKVAVGGGSLVYGLVEVTGLPTLFDTLLTFLPGGGALSAFTPAHPDGFRSADALQVWTGDARSMPDWSQAQSLICAAATNPLPGQVVTFADSLPDPALGHARYYLVSSVSGPDRRLGRQYVNAVYSARNPTTLPVCVP